MKITKDMLSQWRSEEEFQGIPTLITSQQCQGKPWWNALETLQFEGAKATVWEGCQIIATVFDTYGGVIEGIEINVNVEADKSDSYMTTSVYINDEHCFDGDINLEEDVIHRCEENDNMETLSWAVSELDMLGNSSLLPQLRIFEDAFEHKFTSAEQAREMARKVAPEIDKWFTMKVLSEQAKHRMEERDNKRAPKI